jgi:hypothetical protein
MSRVIPVALAAVLTALAGALVGLILFGLLQSPAEPVGCEPYPRCMRR